VTRSSVGLSAYAVYKTLAISLPTVAEALRGRLTVEACDLRLRDWSSRLIARTEVELDVSGLEHVPRDRACLLMSNHQSYADIPICYATFPGTLRMVAKAELFRVPIWGRAMRDAGFVAVDRSGDRQSAVASMRSAREALARGINIWIAPEGTRSPDGRIGRFKKGGFLLALDSGAPIVPLAIDGSKEVIPKHSWRIVPGGRVRVVYGPPIATAGRSIDELQAALRAFLQAHVREPA
jgi:1-acyl-sn-glycerol-3-phosphate acyltransferase